MTKAGSDRSGMTVSTRRNTHRKCVFISKSYKGKLRDCIKRDSAHKKPKGGASHAAIVAVCDIGEDGEVSVLCFQVDEEFNGVKMLRWALPTETAEPHEDEYETACVCVQMELAWEYGSLQVEIEREPIYVEEVQSDGQRGFSPSEELLGVPVLVEVQDLLHRMTERPNCSRPFHKFALVKVLEHLCIDRKVFNRYADFLAKMQTLLFER